jgi:hypothetical protein
MRSTVGLTYVEVLVAAALVTLVLMLALVMLSMMGRANGGPSRTGTAVRGIHQGLVIFAQGNRLGDDAGFYPGLEADGELYEDGTLTRYAPEGASYVAAEANLIDNVFAMLLDGNYFVPDYAVHQADPDIEEDDDGIIDASTDISFAILRYDHPELRGEWAETINTDAIVLADRPLAGTATNPQSVWSGAGHPWKGMVARNDGSTQFEQDAAFTGLRYGDSAAFDTANIFSPDYGVGTDRGQLFWE